MDAYHGDREPWVNVEHVAAHLGVGKESIYRWVESRGLPAHRAGRLFRFRLSEVDAWMAGRRVDRGPPGPRVAGGPQASTENGAREAARTTPDVEGAIQEMVRRIVERFDPETIILFGSHARGDAGPDGDVDLLVVMPLEGSKSDKEIELGVALHDIRIPKDILVVTPDELERYRDVIGTIVRPALQEGRTLYQRAA